MENNKPRLFSRANRHQLITQVIAGLLVLLIGWLAIWLWSDLSSSSTANGVNVALAASWNWTIDQLGVIADALSADVTVARWKMLLFLSVFAALMVVTLVPRIRSAFKSPRFTAAANEALDATLNDITRMFGLPRLTLSVEDSEVDAADEPKQDALETREELALVVLAQGDWLDNEVHAKEIADKLGGNIHAAELALVGLFEKGYVKDSYHSGYRWFRLSTKGQEYAIKEGIVQDLDFPF